MVSTRVWDVFEPLVTISWNFADVVDWFASVVLANDWSTQTRCSPDVGRRLERVCSSGASCFGSTSRRCGPTTDFNVVLGATITRVTKPSLAISSYFGVVVDRIAFVIRADRACAVTCGWLDGRGLRKLVRATLSDRLGTRWRWLVGACRRCGSATDFNVVLRTTVT